MPSQTIDLSIIVAIHKVEPYLKQCIESVLKQDYPCFELILVDDGSPDRCPSICDEYAVKDSRVRVIHQSNQGVVTARWKGILASSGEYISLIDGDDWVEPDMYGHMMNLVKQNAADMAVVGYQVEEPQKTTLGKNEIDSGIYTENRIECIYQRALYNGTYYLSGIIPAFWNKIIRRDLFFEDYKPAASIIRLGEDAAVTYPMIARSKTIVIENEFHPYHYRILGQSMSRAFDDLYFDRVIALLNGLYENLAPNKSMQSCLKYYGIFLTQIGILMLFARSNKKSFKRKMEILRRYSNEYRKIGITDRIDWDGFDRESKALFEPFFTDDLRLMILRLYQSKIKAKLKKARELRKMRNKS